MAAQGVWSADLAKESSTMLEILAVGNVLQSFAHKLAELCVKWHTENQNVARIIDVGSRKSGLHSEAKLFLGIAFIMSFLSSLNGYPDPEMSTQII